MLGSILVPTDGSRCSMRAALFAAELVKINTDIQIHILIVDNALRRFARKNLCWLRSRGNEEQLTEEKFKEECYNILEDTAAVFCERANMICNYRFGNPAEIICSYAEDNKLDLIVLGSRGFRLDIDAVQKVSLGSVSYKVLQLSSLPVIVVN